MQAANSTAQTWGAGADLKFYKGGCPIRLKKAPEIERRKRPDGVPPLQNMFAFLTSKW